MPEGAPDPKPKKWIAVHFDYIDTTRARCKTCGIEVDVRAGRAWTHWKRTHGEGSPPKAEKEKVPIAEGSGLVEPAVPDGGGVPRPPDGGGAEAPPPRARELPPERPRKRKERAEGSEATAVGSRAWAVKEVLSIIREGGTTPEQRLKALDLLKEYEDFGTNRLDDEKEAEASRLQWERVLAEVKDLRDEEAALLKDPAVRNRLRGILEAP